MGCRKFLLFPNHKWSSWDIIRHGRVLGRHRENVIGFYIDEKRYCTVCGKTQIKLQEV